jgi:hypothetical protein
VDDVGEREDLGHLERRLLLDRERSPSGDHEVRLEFREIPESLQEPDPVDGATGAGDPDDHAARCSLTHMPSLDAGRRADGDDVCS